LQAAGLAVIPVCIVVLAVSFTRAVGDFDADPDYAYLFNSLNVLSLTAPAHVDHPGTTLQIWGAIVVGGVWLGRWAFVQMPLQTDVVLHPEAYLGCINATLAAAIGGATFVLGSMFRASTKSFAIAVAAQSSLLVSLPVMIALPRVTPEPLLLCLTLMLVALLAPLVFAGAAETSGRAIFLGTVFGACLVTKITTGPIALLLLLLRTWRARLIAVSATFVVVAALTLPIATHYRRMFDWFVALLVHKGNYGTGDVGLPSWADISDRLVQIASDTPEVIISLVICVAMLFVCIQDRRRLWLFAICAAVLSLQLAAVVKHPGTRYVLPSVPVIALVIGAIGERLRREVAVICLLGAMLGAGIWHNARAASAWVEESYAIQRDNAELLKQVSQSGCAIVPYYDAKTQEFKLIFGNAFAGRAFTPLLAKVYPEFVSYNVPARFETFDHVVDAAEWQRRFGGKQCVYLIGSPVERFEKFGLPTEALRLIARTMHGVGDALAVYDFRR
jgi:hypothetical protein